jgi:Domain of unknown function (DUF4602)
VKPPVLDHPILTKSPKQSPPSTEEGVAEAINLKHDLELQRLLKESHLLDSSSRSTLTHAHRHKAMDLRMQSLGSKVSLFTQAKMPVSHRQGIIAKANQREATRRKEALENGIILERRNKQTSEKAVKREHGIGGPAIGKFKGGTLKLSRRDIIDLQGPQGSHKVMRKRGKS